jgi:hypothetical protein
VLQSRGQETRRRFDTIVCGTGFEVDVGKWTHLDQEMRDSIVRIGRAPRLDRNFETSARGLHVAGPASSASFGPLFRFVAGARYTARVVARHLRGSK